MTQSVTEAELDQTTAVAERENSDLLEVMETLPSYVARGLIYFLITLAVTAVTFTAVCKIDIVRQGQATVIPEGKPRLVQADTDGVVLSLDVREGDAVTAGQPLMVIESKEVTASLASLQAAEIELDDARREVEQVLPLRIEQLKKQRALLEEKAAALDRAKLSIEERIKVQRESLELIDQSLEVDLNKHEEAERRLDLQIVNSTANLELWKNEYEATLKLQQSKAATSLQLLSAQRQYESAKAEVQKEKSQRAELDREQDAIIKRSQAARKQQEAALLDVQMQAAQNRDQAVATLAEAAQIEDQVRLTRAEADKRLTTSVDRHRQAMRQAGLNLRGVSPEVVQRLAGGADELTNRTTIRAPTSGRIVQMTVRAPGELIQAGRTLITLLPLDIPLIAEIRIPNRDMGLVREGLPVKLKFDAFPFNEYGIVRGNIVRVVPHADDEQPATGGGAPAGGGFRIYATLERTYLVKDGQPRPLLSGMTASAEVVTDRKAILMIFLEPFQKLAASVIGGG